jgi:hypothetical protein
VRVELLGQNARVASASGNRRFCTISRPGKRLWHYLPGIRLSGSLLLAQLATVVYKVAGRSKPGALLPGLQADYDTAVALCHRDTRPIRSPSAQPFALLGHNGEINTIRRLRVEGEQIGAILPRDGSDSQDLDRILHTLCVNYDISLVEAMEMVFPPPPDEVELLPQDQRAAYNRLRQAFGPYAQGPAAIVSRYGNVIVASVDALGLRPLWFVETEKEYVLTSERGAVPLEVMVTPSPISAGKRSLFYSIATKGLGRNHHQIRACRFNPLARLPACQSLLGGLGPVNRKYAVSPEGQDRSPERFRWEPDRTGVATGWVREPTGGAAVYQWSPSGMMPPPGAGYGLVVCQRVKGAPE